MTSLITPGQGSWQQKRMKLLFKKIDIITYKLELIEAMTFYLTRSRHIVHNYSYLGLPERECQSTKIKKKSYMNKTHANYLFSTFHVFVIKGVIHFGFLSNQLKSPSDLNRLLLKRILLSTIKSFNKPFFLYTLHPLYH